MASTLPKPKPTPNNLSFGVELEFVFYYKMPENPELPPEKPTGKESPLSPEEDQRLPRPLIPPAELVYPTVDKFRVRDWAVEQVTAAILSVPGAKVLAAAARLLPRHTPTNPLYLYPDQGWEVKDDISVRDLVTPPVGADGYGYRAVPFEINSPALWDEPASYRHVAAVVDALRRRLRLRVNLHTGMHVHVGAGFDWHVDRATGRPIVPAYDCAAGSDRFDPARLPLRGPRKHSRRVLRRAAALLWAADAVLCHAHPPERCVNTYARSVRQVSGLARGVEQETAAVLECGGGEGGPWGKVRVRDRRDRPMVVTAPAPAPAAVGVGGDGGGFRFGDRYVFPTERKRMPSETVPRGKEGGYFPVRRLEKLDEEAWQRYEVMPNYETVRKQGVSVEVVNGTVARGVARLMRCKSRLEVARLFELPVKDLALADPRCNYNFKSYREFNTKGYWPLLKRTVEFREAAGSLDPDWVATWARICVGIFRFSRSASDARFMAVIDRLEKAESEAMLGTPHRYDLISFLADLGLVAESLFLEKKLRDDPVRGFWYPNLLEEKEGWDEVEGQGTTTSGGMHPVEELWESSEARENAPEGEW